eukprot:349615-Chlamydomonas_euryale.AAC.11
MRFEILLHRQTVLAAACSAQFPRRARAWRPAWPLILRCWLGRSCGLAPSAPPCVDAGQGDAPVAPTSFSRCTWHRQP